MSKIVLSLVVGLVGVWVFIRAVRRLGPARELRWYAGGLVIAAGIYVAFGLVLGGAPLGYELVQLAVFAPLAAWSLRHSVPVLAAGWLAHALWDAAHWIPTLSGHAPEWYMMACLSFDVVLGLYIFTHRDALVVGDEPEIAMPQPEHQG